MKEKNILKGFTKWLNEEKLQELLNLNESVTCLNDEDADAFIRDNKWSSVLTYEYNFSALNDFGKILPNVIYTKDLKYIYLPGNNSKEIEDKINNIVKKYNISSLD